MRRKEKEVTDKSVIESVLNEAIDCKLGLSLDDKPYIIPMNFVYYENCVYLHSAIEGKKIDILEKNNNVCVEAQINTELVKSEKACNWGMKYLSVIGFGKADFITESEDKKNALNLIMKKYSGIASWDIPDDVLDGVAVIKIVLESITCKKSGF